MKQELKILFATYSAYNAFSDKPWLARALWIGLALVVLKFMPDSAKYFVMVVLTWNIIDALMNVSKNEGDNQCTSIVSILKNALTGKKVPEESLTEKDLMSNSSQQPTEESTPHPDLMSTPPSTDAQ
jgi:hypothetical protein